MTVRIRPMTPDDYETVYALWQATEGMGLGQADTREAITRYLERNPGLSFTAWDGAELVGAVLAGHDGRRGYLHHLAVAPSHRKQGVGRALTACCEQALLAEGIEKAHLFVLTQNTAGQAFWRQAGWYERPELVLMSRDINDVSEQQRSRATSTMPRDINDVSEQQRSRATSTMSKDINDAGDIAA